MAGEPDINTSNTIGGGNQYGPVFQGRYFDVTVQAAASAPVALAQLPPTVTGFTGRGDELLMVTNFLDPASAAEAVVVSAVAGLAGVGKTTLAVAAGHAVRERGWYQGGVLFIDLHGYDDRHVEPGQALDAMLRALGVPGEHIPPGTEERCGLYRSVLAQISEPVLVIADNASSEAQVRLLLPGEGPHRAVVTSRHTLAGLDARLLDITVLDTEAGVALLEAALAAARPDDQRVSADRPNAARLAETCGGLPLALQITAALLKADPTLTVSELADELADELVLLQKLRYDDGSGSGSPSVAAAFELSYRQLDETAARVFRLLPVNPGPDLSTAAAAVLADLPTGELRSVLSRLAQAHLIEAAAGAARRWRMHDLLRLYALQRSDACALPDGREQAVDRLLQYYEETAHAATTHLSVPSEIPLSATFTDRDNALTWLDAERPNLIAAVVTAANTGREQISIKLSADLPVYLELRRRFDDLLVICTVCLDATRRLGKRANEAGALNDLGNTLLVVRRFEEAIVVYQDAIAIFQEIDEPRFRALALNHLGIPLREVGRLEEAVTSHQDAAAIFRETGDRHSEGDALGNLGVALGEVHRFEEAVTAHQDATAIFRETGDRHREGKAFDGLGLALEDMHQFEDAIAAHKRAIAILQETDDRHGEGSAMNNLGISFRHLGRFKEATNAHQNAATIFHETGDRYGVMVALNNIRLDLEEQHT